MAGAVATLGGSVLAAPSSAWAGPRVQHRPAASRLSYRVQVVAPDPTGGVTRAIDLNDRGAVLVTNGSGSFVVRGSEVTKLSQVTSDGIHHSVSAGAMNNAFKVSGSGMDLDVNMYLPGFNVHWDTPSSPVVLNGGGACTPDYHDFIAFEKMNSAGYVLKEEVGHGGRNACLVSPSNVSRALPYGDGSGAWYSSPVGLSNDNQIVGWGTDASHVTRGFVLKDGTATWLENPASAGETHATTISPSGKWIVGASGNWNGVTPSVTALKWNASRKVVPLAGAPKNFVPGGINNSGAVVGSAGGNVYLVRGGKAISLSNLASLSKEIPAGTAVCEKGEWGSATTHINSKGQILADICGTDGQISGAVLFTPSNS